MDPTREPLSSEAISYKAAHAVLNTHEFLHDIIVRLPVNDLIVAIGVCQTWRKALKESKSIQQALFLTPVDVRDITSEADCHLSMSLDKIPRDQYTVVGEPRPFVRTLWFCKEPTGIEPTFDIHLQGRTKRRRTLTPGGWRNMFATQPPSKSVKVAVIPSTIMHGHQLGRPVLSFRDKGFKLTCETGVRLGELHGFCQSELRKREIEFRIQISFDPERFIESRHLAAGGRWEVRNSKIFR